MTYLFESEAENICSLNNLTSQEFDLDHLKTLMTNSLIEDDYDKTIALVSKIIKQVIPNIKFYSRELKYISDYVYQTSLIKTWKTLNSSISYGALDHESLINNFSSMLEEFEYEDIESIQKRENRYNKKSPANVADELLHLTRLTESDNFNRELKTHNFNKSINIHMEAYKLTYKNVYNELNGRSGIRDFSFFCSNPLNIKYERTIDKIYYDYFYRTLIKNPFNLSLTEIKYTEYVFLREHNIPLAMSIECTEKHLAECNANKAHIDIISNTLYLLSKLVSPYFVDYSIYKIDNHAKSAFGSYNRIDINVGDIDKYTELYNNLIKLFKVITPTIEIALYTYYKNSPIESIESLIKHDLWYLDIFEYSDVATSENTISIIKKMNKSLLLINNNQYTEQTDDYDIFELFRSRLSET